MTNTIQDSALQMALEKAILKHNNRIKKDIIRWGLLKAKVDVFVSEEQIEELAEYTLEEVLDNVYSGIFENNDEPNTFRILAGPAIMYDNRGA